MKTRLPTHATTYSDMVQYYQTRARQLHYEGLILKNVIEREADVAHAYFVDRYTDIIYQSLFIPSHKMGHGLFHCYRDMNIPFLTMNECNLVHFFQRHHIPYRMAGTLLNHMEEYQLITQYYGNQYAQRSRMFLMNHVDEGISILHQIGASEAAIRAYCLHPMLQMDDDCRQNLSFVTRQLQHENAAYVISLAMEYRMTANRYLSYHTMSPDGILLSPLKEVNDMLIADKIQNAKDFERYHKNTHPRASRLTDYFNEWHTALGVTEDTYQRFKETLPSFPEDCL